jgi:hypothetical protein
MDKQALVDDLGLDSCAWRLMYRMECLIRAREVLRGVRCW